MPYTSEKPNFCMKCGKGFAGHTAVASQDDAEEEGDPDVSIPLLNKLDVEFIPEASDGKVTLGQIFEEAARQDAPPQDDPSYEAPQRTAEEAVEELKREAGTLRPKPDKNG
jgi:hypothetical protein